MNVASIAPESSASIASPPALKLVTSSVTSGPRASANGPAVDADDRRGVGDVREVAEPQGHRLGIAGRRSPTTLVADADGGERAAAAASDETTAASAASGIPSDIVSFSTSRNRTPQRGMNEIVARLVPWRREDAGAGDGRTRHAGRRSRPPRARRCWSRPPRIVGVTALAAASGLTVSTTHRLLKALAAAGLVAQDRRHRALPPRRRR